MSWCQLIRTEEQSDRNWFTCKYNHTHKGEMYFHWGEINICLLFSVLIIVYAMMYENISTFLQIYKIMLILWHKKIDKIVVYQLLETTFFYLGLRPVSVKFDNFLYFDTLSSLETCLNYTNLRREMKWVTNLADSNIN